MRCLIKFVILSVLVVCAKPASADLSFNNRADFTNAIDPALVVTAIDFEGFVGSQPSISFNLPSGPGFSSYAPGTPMPATNLLVNEAGFNNTTITLKGLGGALYSFLPGGTFAVGADFEGRSVDPVNHPATFTVETRYWNSNIVSSITFGDTNSPRFIGFVSTSNDPQTSPLDIRSLYITSDVAGAVVTLDNYTFAHSFVPPIPSSVPEPTSLLLGGTAVSLLAVRRLRRWRNVSA